MNGRIDLSQAEAVIDLIRAKSDKSFDTALAQLEGNFSKVIRDLRGLLVDVLVDLTVNIDYPDEDIEQITFENLTLALKEIRSKLAALLATSATGRMLREGMQVAIIGKPNVGKSSLMNALLRETRAIVTEIPGTTRDTIEEGVSVRGIPIRLTDTAGIRQTEDVIEKIGIEKSKESFNRADLVIFMIDRSQPLDEEDYEIIRHLDGKKSIVILNKTDLPPVVSDEEARALLPEVVLIEAAVGQNIGITELEDAIENLVYGGRVKQQDSILVSNVRHIALLEEAQRALDDAIGMAESLQPLEFLEIDVNHAYELLGEIIGEAVGDDIIEEVFARFCLGK